MRWTKMLPMQQGDFEAMYKALEGRPDDRPLSGPAAP